MEIKVEERRKNSKSGKYFVVEFGNRAVVLIVIRWDVFFGGQAWRKKNFSTILKSRRPFGSDLNLFYF